LKSGGYDLVPVKFQFDYVQKRTRKGAFSAF